MEKFDAIKLDLNISAANASAPVYKCSQCQDTGWVQTAEGVMPCGCRIEEVKKQKNAACGLTPILAQKTFESFDITYYEEFLRNEKGSTYRMQAKKIFETCKHYAETFTPQKTFRGIVLQGDVGRGKTFLAAAVCNKLIERGYEPYFLVVPEFLDEIRASYNSGGEFSEAKIMEKAMKVPFLVLDDLGSHNFSQWTVSKLFTLLNYRVNHGLPFMITTNLSIAELQQLLGDRIISRIAEACDFYCLQAGNDIRMVLNMKHMGESRD